MKTQSRADVARPNTLTAFGMRCVCRLFGYFIPIDESGATMGVDIARLGKDVWNYASRNLYASLVFATMADWLKDVAHDGWWSFIFLGLAMPCALMFGVCVSIIWHFWR